jgi:hypothetical protein
VHTVLVYQAVRIHVIPINIRQHKAEDNDMCIDRICSYTPNLIFVSAGSLIHTPVTHMNFPPVHVNTQPHSAEVNI